MSTADEELVDENPLPDDLEQLQAYRKAARVIVRDPGLTVIGKCVGLIRLAERARQEAAMPEWALEAVWREGGPFILDEPDGALSPDPWERRHRMLRHQGRVLCPECGCHLPGDGELDRQARIRLAAIAEARAREGAVQ